MSTQQEQIEFILDHYENPRHHGALEHPDVVMKGGNPGCGDIVTMYLKLDGDERIADVSFEGVGCTISQAAASMLTEKVVGMSMADVAELDLAEFIDEMGKDVVINRLRCATLAANTVKAALEKYRAGQAVRSADAVDVENF